MAYSAIQQSEINNGAIFDQALLQKIKDNFDAQQADLGNKQVTLDSHASTLTSHSNSISSNTSGLVAHGTRINKAVPVGTVRSSTLSLAQFSSQVDGTWQLMDGGSCVGTAYATLTGNTTVPNATTEGTFLRQAKTGRSLGSYEADDNKDHFHGLKTLTASTNAAGGSGLTNNFNVTDGVWWDHGSHYPASTHARSGGTEARPKNTAVNFFIKVGY